MAPRWTKRRIARLAFLCGAGASPDDIARDELVAARSPRAVRTVASRLGVAIRAGGDPFVVPLSPGDRRQLLAAARRRGASPASLAGTVLHIVLHDRLLSAVLDDGR